MTGGAERGSGTPLALALMAGMLAVVVVVVPLYSVFAVRSRLAAAADAAALAAADVRSGFTAAGQGAEPCAVAGTIADAAGAALAACQVDGLVVTVTVETGILGLAVQQTATAGPPPAASDLRRARGDEWSGRSVGPRCAPVRVSCLHRGHSGVPEISSSVHSGAP